jgi:hypothetical protein
MLARSEAGFPWLFLTILVAWLVMLFFSFGLLAPRNPTVLCIIFLCSLSVACAVFPIVDRFTALFKSPAFRCATRSANLGDDRFCQAAAEALRRRCVSPAATPAVTLAGSNSAPQLRHDSIRNAC